jgi:methylenetetrahydrofolate reductase (NADPH)
MKVTEALAQADGCLFSFEVLPPKKGESADSIFQTVEELLEFKPSFIDVTSHAAEVILRDMGGGLVRPVKVKNRPGTLGVCAAIHYRYKVPVVPHLICSGFSAEETEDALLELSFLGIQNVMALRGDPGHGSKRFTAAPGGHAYASDLVKQIATMNEGKLLDGTSAPTSFCIGVAGYPEKHMESPNPAADLARLKEKVDAGAGFIVTQMFFENREYFQFVDLCRAAGIQVPIIPGLKPLSSKNQLSLLPQTFHINMPIALVEAVEKAADAKAVRKVGVEWCIEQSRELKAKGAPCLHYYTMAKAKMVAEIARAVF